MIKTAIVAMTIVGCDCDARMCEFIRGEQPQWTTMAECETALKTRIVRDQHESYPTVIAVCSVPDDNQRALAMAAFNEALTAEATPAAPFVDGDERSRIETIVSGGRAVVSRTTSGYANARDAVVKTASSAFSLVSESVSKVTVSAISAVRAAW
jgi:hypothetical protein